MDDFSAPLFLGDDSLLRCLNGEATMGDRETDAAPTDSMRRVQTALQRLGYALGAAGPDGLWGHGTYQAVLAFKTALDIRAPEGHLDGYVGRRKVAALEGIYTVPHERVSWWRLRRRFVGRSRHHCRTRGPTRAGTLLKPFCDCASVIPYRGKSLSKAR